MDVGLTYIIIGNALRRNVKIGFWTDVTCQNGFGNQKTGKTLKKGKCKGPGYKRKLFVFGLYILYFKTIQLCFKSCWLYVVLEALNDILDL